MLIGKRAICKETGLGHNGIIVGTITGEGYLASINRPLEELAKWNRVFPEWEKDILVYIKLDKPARNCTYDEFLEGLKVHYDLSKASDYELMIAYEKSVPLIRCTACPIAGIEIESSKKHEFASRN